MFEKRKDPPAPPEPAASPPQSTSTPDTFTSRSTAVIGQTIKIKGTIEGDENLIIEGSVEGAVNLPNNDLTVGPSGKVKADLDAKTVKIDGEVTGDISGTEKVIVSKTGLVKGNIVAPRVTLEDGAKFKGSIDMDPSPSSSSSAAAPASGPKTAKPSGTGSDTGNEAKQEAS
ncbi:MAG: polymer-forming cytoskeletal protein [Pseudomonadota bacterium]